MLRSRVTRRGRTGKESLAKRELKRALKFWRKSFTRSLRLPRSTRSLSKNLQADSTIGIREIII